MADGTPIQERLDEMREPNVRLHSLFARRYAELVEEENGISQDHFTSTNAESKEFLQSPGRVIAFGPDKQ